MNAAALLDSFKSGFCGVVSQRDLVLDKRKSHIDPCGSAALRYSCPCGGVDHVATRSADVSFGTSRSAGSVLNCYETGRRWLVLTDAAGSISCEEGRFVKLMDRHAHLMGARVGGEEAFRLVSECGVPEEMLDVSDRDRYADLFESHRDSSRGKHRNGVVR